MGKDYKENVVDSIIQSHEDSLMNKLRCLECDKLLAGQQVMYCSIRCSDTYRKRNQYHNDPEFRERKKRIVLESYHRKRPHLKHRSNRPKYLNGHSKRGDSLLLVIDKGGCYTCCRLKGTMLNTYTNQTVAICEEQQMQHAPHPKDGCHLLKPYSSGRANFRLRDKRRRQKLKINIKQGDWHGVAKRRKELGIDGWEVIIFFKNAIAYREFLCEVHPEEEMRQAILDYINKER